MNKKTQDFADLEDDEDYYDTGFDRDYLKQNTD